MVVFIVGVSCATQRSTSDRKEVSKVTSNNTSKDLPSTHYSRAISMVEADQGLNPTEKQNLTRLITEFADKKRKNDHLKLKYKSMLVHEMLNTNSSRNSKAEATQDELTDLSEKSDKDLQKFIQDFKFHAGENARLHQSTLLEIINQ